jgi:hypothetical protein
MDDIKDNLDVDINREHWDGDDNLTIDLQDVAWIEHIISKRLEPFPKIDNVNYTEPTNEIKLNKLRINGMFKKLDNERFRKLSHIEVVELDLLLGMLAKYSVQTLKLYKLDFSRISEAIDTYTDRDIGSDKKSDGAKCYEDPYCKSNTSPGWTIKKIVIKECFHVARFAARLFSDEICGIGGFYNAENYIEEIHIKNSSIDYGFREQMLEYLEDNYRIRIVNFVNTGCLKKTDAIISRDHMNQVQQEVDICREIDRKMRILLKRNQDGYSNCKSAIYTVLAIKRYRNSVFDYLNKDIVLIVCNLVLATIGTDIWCEFDSNIII